MPSCNTYRLTWVSLTLGMGYLFLAAPAKRSHCSLPWTRGMSSPPPFLTFNVGYSWAHTATVPWTWDWSSQPPPHTMAITQCNQYFLKRNIMQVKKDLSFLCVAHQTICLYTYICVFKWSNKCITWAYYIQSHKEIVIHLIGRNNFFKWWDQVNAAAVLPKTEKHQAFPTQWSIWVFFWMPMQVNFFHWSKE